MTNKSFLLIVFVFVCSFINAQTNDSRYLKGAVPEVDGKVVFSKDIKTKTAISDARLFDLINKRVESKYNDPKDLNNRILLSNPENKNIALLCEKALTFKVSAISLDRAFMRYQLLFEMSDSNCKVTVRNIKYVYTEKDKPETFSAEEMISDKVALNKDGTKLNRYFEKFRVHTIDTINAIFDDVDVFLNGKQIVAAVDNSVLGAVVASQKNETTEIVTAPIVHPSVATENIASIEMSSSNANLDGYRNISVDRIPGNIIKLLNDKVLLSFGAEKATAKTVTNAGLGKFSNQPVMFVYSSQSQNNTDSDVFTVSFYTEAYEDLLTFCNNNEGRSLAELKAKGFVSIPTTEGLSFSGAWMIIECKKLYSVPITEKDVVMKEQFDQLTKNGAVNLNVGQILNVWVK